MISNEISKNSDNFEEGEASKPIQTPKPKATLSNSEIKLSKSFKFVLNLIIIFGVCFLIFSFSFQVVLKPITVAGYSMQPTINQSARGDYGQYQTDTVYYTRFNLNQLTRADVVIINSNYTANSHSLIKRVIGLPGETITFKLNNSSAHINPSKANVCYFYDVYINGEKLDETGSLGYSIKEKMEFELFDSSDIYSFFNAFSQSLTADHTFSYTILNNEYFVMGDNRNNSTDSRYFGPVKFNDIEGKVSLYVPFGSNLAEQILKLLIK